MDFLGYARSSGSKVIASGKVKNGYIGEYCGDDESDGGRELPAPAPRRTGALALAQQSLMCHADTARSPDPV